MVYDVMIMCYEGLLNFYVFEGGMCLLVCATNRERDRKRQGKKERGQEREESKKERAREQL